MQFTFIVELLLKTTFLLYTGYIVCCNCLCYVHVSMYYLLSNQSKNDINWKTHGAYMLKKSVSLDWI